jgi:hypothetical protein
MLRTSRGCSFSRASEAPRRLVEADDAIPDASPRSIGQPLGPGCRIEAERHAGPTLTRPKDTSSYAP